MVYMWDLDGILGLCFNSKLTISKPLLFIRLQDLRQVRMRFRARCIQGIVACMSQ